MNKKDPGVKNIQKWFRDAVAYEGEPYVIDYEQAMAVADESLNTIVVARAGSGKTRTLVAKIVYLVAMCGVKPDEIMAFVFNANAAREINERLTKILVNGKTIMENVRIASTFHAFSRRVVYKICKGEHKCGKILAAEKDAYILEIVRRMLRQETWRAKTMAFIRDGGMEESTVVAGDLSKEEIERFASMMVQFVNRAQQKYLGGKVTVKDVAMRYLDDDEASKRERLFVELGVEVFRRYHWYLLDARWGLDGYSEYGTDFNLVVSWATKLIVDGRTEMVRLLSDKKYILIDEYQDFSQLFLAEVRAIRQVAKEAKLFVVGDDWQAINRFAGSDVEYFKEFEKYFDENVRRVEITTNYRCDRTIVGTARRFMKRAMREDGRFKAFKRSLGKVVVVNPRETELGYALVPYDYRVSVEDRILREAIERMGCVVITKAMVKYLKTVVEIIKGNLKVKDIMILHRNNEMNLGGLSLARFGDALKWGLDKLRIMKREVFDTKVRLMTMHKSKGLEAEVVIILEADEGVMPKLHPDTMLYGIFGENEEVSLADQKRLFYVAMTRAKRRLYIIHDESSGAGFVKYLGGGVEG